MEEIKLQFNPIKQPNNRTCMATCLAIIVGERTEYVLDWFQGNPSYTMEDAFIFLAHHGIYLGFFFRPIDDSFFTLDSNSEISLPLFPMKYRPCLLCVNSKRFMKKLHMVFWDGMDVLDPASGTKEDICSYEILEVWPLILTENRYNDLIHRRKLPTNG
uniref:Uncharacterized protein n=1 Tax=viral metagenome TaxID=1070528 RepID=A0A6M3IVG6_9ZZZZ